MLPPYKCMIQLDFSRYGKSRNDNPPGGELKMINEIRSLHEMASQVMLAVIPDGSKPVTLDPHTRQAIMLLSDAVVSLRNAAKNLELRDEIEPPDCEGSI